MSQSRNRKVTGSSMQRTTLFLLTLVFSIACSAEVPQSILGNWQFDSVRTISEFADAIAAANPGLATPAQIEAQKAQLAARSTENDRQLTATITDDTIRILSATSGPSHMQYEVIGGNARLVVLDATSPESGSLIISIRLVDGGIAMQTIDCQSQPEVCERQDQRTQTSGSTNTISMSVLDGAATSPATRHGPVQPEWIYLRRVHAMIGE